MRGKRNANKRIAVFGCGPAGLFAACAAESLGYQVDIYSRKRKSPLYGAQYLHAPIPGLTFTKPEMVNYQLVGTADEYRLKVYGDRPVDVSPSLLQGMHQAWNIRSTYDAAWASYQHRVIDLGKAIHGNDMARFFDEFAGQYKLTISTIPADQICRNPGHTFSAETVWAVGDAPELNRWCPVRIEPWTVICDGTDQRGWYRVSNVFGHRTAEWATEHKPPVEEVVEVVKPIATNCDCFARYGLERVGRYGAWKKGVLSHEAYEQTMKVLG